MATTLRGPSLNTARSRRPSPTIDQLATVYLVRAADWLKPGTLAMYAQSIRAFVAFAGADVTDVTDLTIARFMKSRLQDGKAATTVRGDYRRLRHGFFAWCVEQGHLEANPCTLARQPKEPKRPGRTVTEEQFRQMLAMCDDGEAPYRDRALLHLLWDTGCRIGELVSADYADVDVLERHTILLRAENTKTLAERLVPFTKETGNALFEYLTFERGHDPGPLVVSRRTGVRLRRDSATGLVRDMAKRAGVDVSAHDFRRAFVQRCQAAGMADSLIMELTGHRSVAMIVLYAKGRARENALNRYRELIG